MPASKAKSNKKRTLRPKKECHRCESLSKLCHEKAIKSLDLACAVERAELERDVMLDVMAKAWERANTRYQKEYDFATRILEEKWKMIDENVILLRDLQLVQAGCTRELGGSVWIRGEQIAECLNRYTNGRCVK